MLTNNLMTIPLNKIMGLIILLIVHLLLTSCSPVDDSSDKPQQSIYELHSNSRISNDTLPELTQEQQSAFDALNTLQVNTDKKNRLYSTFANINQPCYPPDSSFIISRSELLVALNQFVTNHCKNLKVEKRNELVKTAVLAQEEYTLLLCTDNFSKLNFETGPPLTGIWVFPDVLGRRDVVLKW